MDGQFGENPPKTQSECESPVPLASLISALDLAAQSTKTLTLTPTAVSSLRSAHRPIGSFLSQFPPDNDGDDEQMLDQNEEEETESKIMDEVEVGMRECLLQSKRRKKRHVSPSWVTGRDADRGEELSSVDPMDQRRSVIDLVFQFHA